MAAGICSAVFLRNGTRDSVRAAKTKNIATTFGRKVYVRHYSDIKIVDNAKGQPP
jgi:hypothetical protein